MSQHDFNVANQGFPAFRGDMNNALAALASNSSGATAPSTTYAYQWWYDTTTNILKMRNADNDAWISFATFDQANDKFTMTLAGATITGQAVFDDGSASLPSLTNTGDTNTGLFFPAADAVAVATGGAERVRVTSAGSLLMGTTAVPTSSLIRQVVAGDGAYLQFSRTATTIAGAFAGTDGNGLIFGTHTGAVGSETYTERARITSSGQFLVGRTTPRVNEFASITGSPGSGEWMLECVNTRSTTSLNGILVFYPNAAPNNTTNQFFQCVDGLSTTRAEIRSNGGLANFSANNVNLSDERVKTDIAPVGSYWDKIKALQVVTYKYKDQSHDDDNIGVIAQQVESVAPEFVSNDGFGETPEDGVPLKSIYEADLHYATLKALQEAMAKIEYLEARVAALEA